MSKAASKHPLMVTGAAGFVGFHLSQRLLAKGFEVIGLDNVTPYYDPELKRLRLKRLGDNPRFSFCEADLTDHARLNSLVSNHGIRRMIHLAAQAGVRYSLTHPFVYQSANLEGHLSVLEACRHAPEFEHLIYASSSSVYGERAMNATGFQETDATDAPVSLYAATKRAGELMSQSYAHLYGLRQSGLRFFTAYGPYGRPDMAYFSFAEKITNGTPIDIFGDGSALRDYTYIDDLIDAIMLILESPPQPNPHEIYNIGCHDPKTVLDLISGLEDALGKKALLQFGPPQSCDVGATFADITKLKALGDFAPKTPLKEGLARFVEWYKSYRQK